MSLEPKDDNTRSSLRGLQAPDGERSLPPGVRRGNPTDPSKKRLPRWAIYLLFVFVLAGLSGLIPWLLAHRAVVVKVGSIPSGVEVLIDGQSVGVTPVEYRSPRRGVALQVELLGKNLEPYRRSLKLPLWGLPESLQVAMPLQRGKLQIHSQPAAAQVLVDGRERCETPCVFAELAPRQLHKVELLHQGCADAVDYVLAQPGEPLAMRFDLAPARVDQLSLFWVSAIHTIKVDGIDRTNDFSQGPLFFRPGRHLLELGEGEKRSRDLIQLQPGKSHRLILNGLNAQPPRPILKAEGNELIINETGGSRAPEPADLTVAKSGIVDSHKGAPEPVLATVSSLAEYGLYLLARGDGQQAKAYYLQALSLDHQDPRPFRGLIAAALELGDLSLARGQLAALLELHAEFPDREMLTHLYKETTHSGACQSAKDSPK